jgi:hypothetical protein
VSTNDKISGGKLTLADIEGLARRALHEHGLAEQGWNFGWDRALRRAGCCHHAARRISLSKPTFEVEEKGDASLDTTLHEVAHALVGANAGHGSLWRAMALQITKERAGVGTSVSHGV